VLQGATRCPILVKNAQNKKREQRLRVWESYHHLYSFETATLSCDCVFRETEMSWNNGWYFFFVVCFALEWNEQKKKKTSCSCHSEPRLVFLLLFKCFHILRDGVSVCYVTLEVGPQIFLKPLVAFLLFSFVLNWRNPYSIEKLLTLEKSYLLLLGSTDVQEQILKCIAQHFIQPKIKAGAQSTCR